MSIIIRGMAMPKDGRKHTAVLQFLEDGKCRAIVEYSKSYDDRSVKVFEAVPLPERHGRLIDANELELDLVRHNGAIGFELIGNAPTVVPAEGGEEA